MLHPCVGLAGLGGHGAAAAAPTKRRISRRARHPASPPTHIHTRRRRVYDQTGSLEDSEELAGEQFNQAYSAFRAMFAKVCVSASGGCPHLRQWGPVAVGASLQAVIAGSAPPTNQPAVTPPTSSPTPTLPCSPGHRGRPGALPRDVPGQRGGARRPAALLRRVRGRHADGAAVR